MVNCCTDLADANFALAWVYFVVRKPSKLLMLPCGIQRDIIVSLAFFQPVGCAGGGRPFDACLCIVISDCEAVLPRGRIS
eukprot:737806-Pleurochrysis_carterae.AAC.1